MSTAKLEHIHNRRKLTVSHFLRQIRSLLPAFSTYNTPNGVRALCILYYGNYLYQLDAQWIGWRLQYDADTRILKCAKPHETGSQFCFAYFEESTAHGRHSWAFKINQISDPFLLIGIKAAQSSMVRNAPVLNYVIGPSYYYANGYNGCAEIWSKCMNKLQSPYGAYLKKGDIITMILDLDERELRYMVNDVDYGVAASSIAKCKYRAVIVMRAQGDALELL